LQTIAIDLNQGRR